MRDRDQMNTLAPPTREEIARTIFVGNITDGCCGDEGLHRILGVAGGLRRWNRCLDADNKPCSFGFAEYEDADSLRTAGEVFTDVQVPKNKPGTKSIKKEKANGVKKEEDEEMKDGYDAEKEEEEENKPDMVKLLIVIDDNSKKYIEEWSNRGSLADPASAQFRFDSARDELTNVLAGLSRPATNGYVNGIDHEGDASMQDSDTKVDAVTGEIVNIPLNAEDELSDIPAEMRETVAQEIRNFRDRSVRRDLERLKREEELEAAEKQRSAAGMNLNRLASPPPNGVPSGPSGGSGVQGAPLGPRGFQGAQLPRDYRGGVSFVNGAGGYGGLTQEEEDSDASDDEIERRRQAKKDADSDRLYLEQERKWQVRERTRAAAVEREKDREKAEAGRLKREKETMRQFLKDWNDDEQAKKKTEQYYYDRSGWLRSRAAFRAQEQKADDLDREAEHREKQREQQRHDRDMGLADQFLAEQAEELARPASRQEPQRFTMSLGAAAQKAQAAAAPRRNFAEVEGLLEDEEDEEDTTAKRTLRPIRLEDMPAGASMTAEERADASRQLAKEIPTDKNGLWNWPIKWDYVDDVVITEQLRPFVERKIVEYLGVQEELLVDVVEETVKKRGSPDALVSELEGVSLPLPILPQTPLRSSLTHSL